jgi:hypothetical protein
MFLYFINNIRPVSIYAVLIVIVETPIPKAHNLKVTIGAAELVSCNETQTLKANNPNTLKGTMGSL